MSRWLLKAALVSLLFGCGPSSMEDFHREGEAIARSILEELEQIEDKKQLLDHFLSLKKKTTRLTHLMIRVEKYLKAHPEHVKSPLEESHAVSAALKLQIERILHIEGCDKLLEEVQKESIELLHTYEKKKTKR